MGYITPTPQYTGLSLRNSFLATTREYEPHRPCISLAAHRNDVNQFPFLSFKKVPPVSSSVIEKQVFY